MTVVYDMTFQIPGSKQMAFDNQQHTKKILLKYTKLK